MVAVITIFVLRLRLRLQRVESQFWGHVHTCPHSDLISANLNIYHPNVHTRILCGGSN